MLVNAIGNAIPFNRKRTGIIVFETFSDGSTLMRLGVRDDVLSLWYVDTDDVIITWDVE